MNAKQRRAEKRQILSVVQPEQWVVWKLEDARGVEIAHWVNRHYQQGTRARAYLLIREKLGFRRNT